MTTLFSVIIISLLSCSTTKTPEDVTKVYLKALSNLDFATVKKYTAKESLPMIELMEGFVKEAKPEDLIATKDQKNQHTKCSHRRLRVILPKF